MFGYTPREIAEKIRRCTVYDAAEHVLKLFPHHGLYTAEIDKLNKMIKNRSATWYKLSRIVSKIPEETYDVNDIEILKRVINNRVNSEKNIINKLGKSCIKIYHDLENKNLKNMINYIDKNYTYNRLRIYEKYYDAVRYVPEAFNIFDEIVFKNKKYTNKEIRDKLFGEIENFDQLLDHVKILKPKNNNKNRNIDILYDVIIHLSVPKIQEEQQTSIKTLFAPCALCWRPALKRHGCVQHFRCPAHFYDSVKGLPARKKAYERALEITNKTKPYEKYGELINKLLKKYALGGVGRGFLLYDWGWWEKKVPVGIIQEMLWDDLPLLKEYLSSKNISLVDMEAVIRAVMPLPVGALENEIEEYERIVKDWLGDFRFFLPSLASAELWLRAFHEQFPGRKVDE